MTVSSDPRSSALVARVLVVLNAALLPAHPVHAQESSLRAEILALETRWNDAIVAKDTATVSRILADDFVYVAPNGYVARKAELLAVIADPRGRMEPFTTSEVLVRQYGNAVIVTGRFRQRGTNGGTPYDSNIRYTDVYVRQGNRWQAVSAQASTIPGTP